MVQSDRLQSMLDELELAMGEPGTGSRLGLQAALVNWLETAIFAIGASEQLLALVLLRAELQPDLPSPKNDTTARRARDHLAERLNLARTLVSNRHLATSVQVVGAYPMDDEKRPTISVNVQDAVQDLGMATLGNVSDVRRTERDETTGKAIEVTIQLETRRSNVELICWATTVEAAAVLEDVVNAVLMMRMSAARALGIIEFTSHDSTNIAPNDEMVASGRIQLPLSLITLSILWENRLALGLREVLPRYSIATPRAL